MDIKSYRQQQEELINNASGYGKGDHSPDDIPGRRDASAEERADALCQLAIDPENLDERVKYLLEILGRKSEAVTVRSAAIDMLQTAAFVSSDFGDHQPAIIETMQVLATDPSPTLRERALEYLVQHNDSYARDILTEALQAPGKGKVKQEKAVQLLGIDDHENAATLVREQFEDLSGKAREEAVRVLSADTKSFDKLVGIMRDKSAGHKLRRLTAAGLRELDRTGFFEQAREVLEDSGDSANLKASIVSMAEREVMAKLHLEGLDEAVEQAEKRTQSKALKSASKKYFNARKQK